MNKVNLKNTSVLSILGTALYVFIAIFLSSKMLQIAGFLILFILYSLSLKQFFIRYIRLFLIIASVTCSFILLFFLTFKQIRLFFPIPSINESKIVGYAQYEGYPLLFDTIFFVLFIIVPLLSTYFYTYYSDEKKSTT